MKNLIDTLKESLRIGINDKPEDNPNDDFYITFKKHFGYFSNNNCWNQYVSIEDIHDLQIAPKYQINIGIDFHEVVKNKKGKQIWKTRITKYSPLESINAWNEMMRYIFDFGHDKDMVFIMSEDLGDGTFIREFETSDALICLIGPEKVTEGDAHILFAWK